MFLISDILNAMEEGCLLATENESEVAQLGLTGYGPKEIYGTFLEDEKYLSEISDNAKVVITTTGLKEAVQRKGHGIIVVDNPRNIFFKLHNFLCEIEEYVGESRKTTIGNDCAINENAIIAPYNVVIGDNVAIEENVVIRENVIIGANTIVRAGSVIGAQDFEYKREGDTIFRVSHVGRVNIGEYVELGHGTVIGKAIYPWDATSIGDYTKIGGNVTIGHGAKIGKRNMVSSRNVICGRCQLDNDVWLGPGAIISNGLKIGKKVHIGIGAVVIADIPEGKSVFGNPARTMIVRS